MKNTGPVTVERPAEHSTLRLFALLLLLSGCVVGASEGTGGQPQVRIDTGLVAGALQNGVTSFKGLPYASPPIGPLRWRAPQPADPWSGVRNATAYGAVCMQQWPSTDNGVGAETPSEDCLSLNVFTPRPNAAAALPVMVWIHGGGFVNGSGSPALYDGSYLAGQGVVVVTLNYRLGRLGFFAHPALRAEAGAGESVGNYGLQDLLAALEWVRRNVAAFGGDPGNVTKFAASRRKGIWMGGVPPYGYRVESRKLLVQDGEADEGTALGLGILEMLSLELVLIMLAVGATVGMVAALLGAPVILQALLAAGGAVAMLAVVRPKLAQRLHGGPELLLGPKKLIGMQTVAEDAFDTHNPGTIKVDGERWTAQPYDESLRIEAGDTVQVLQIRGATAYVHPVPRLD